MKYHLAQINIGRMKGVNIDGPIMSEFVAQLDYIYQRNHTLTISPFLTS
jgi:hypothetical protein